jgi:hypothetical protein
MKKALIFGGAALVVGVGAYLWYKNSLKKISDEFTPKEQATSDSAVVYSKKNLEVKDTSGGIDTYKDRSVKDFSKDSWDSKQPY